MFAHALPKFIYVFTSCSCVDSAVSESLVGFVFYGADRAAAYQKSTSSSFGFAYADCLTKTRRPSRHNMLLLRLEQRQAVGSCSLLSFAKGLWMSKEKEKKVHRYMYINIEQ